VPFLHCGRDVSVRDLARQPATVSEDEAGDRNYVFEALVQAVQLEVVKRAVGISIELRKVKVSGHCEGVGPLRNERKRRQKHGPRNGRNGGMTVNSSGRIT
jgi:hypothetical protein